MNTATHAHPAPTWIKAAASIGVVWYAFGLFQFWLGFSTDTAAAVDAGKITTAHGAAIDATPLVIWLAFAAASAAGLIGSALLFGGSPAARTLFALSLISAALYYIWIYVISGTGADRPTEEIYVAAMVVAVTLGFNFLSRRMT
ncbi:hypothetical protein [uncultured Sulfitobacter sp.]|uniref:hypothetical protein n=1 Tax=uncultured Sulfitobacter sp. TaxID=191468 RepID=UPI002611CA1A|nr:hypothetical protein [uncultured Sulfitobacter sp.]